MFDNDTYDFRETRHKSRKIGTLLKIKKTTNHTPNKKRLIPKFLGKFLFYFFNYE